MTDSPAPVKEPYVWKRPDIDWGAHLAKVKAYRERFGANWDMVQVAECGCGSLDDLPHFMHPSFAIGPRDSVFGGNLLASLFRNNEGHTKLLVVHNPGEGTLIPAVMDNEVTIKHGNQVEQVFGACQKGCATAIDYCVLLGILPNDLALRNKLVCGVEVYVDAKATELERVYCNTVVSVVAAIVSAVTGGASIEAAPTVTQSKHVFASLVEPMPLPDMTQKI